MAGMSKEDADAFLGPEPAPPVAGKMSAADADAFLGPDPKPPGMSQLDDFGQPAVGSSPENDAFLAQHSIGRVLHAFGQGAADGWGAGDIGISEQTAEGLRKAGIFPDVEKGQGGLLRAFNEAVIRPAGAALDLANRTFGAATQGSLSAAVAGASEIGGEQFGRGIGGIGESALADLGSRMPAHGGAGPVDLPAARDLGVIGEPEAVFRGVTDAKIAPDTIVNDNAAGVAPPADPASPVTSDPMQGEVLPPVAPGSIRFYHGGNVYEGGARWLSEDRRTAEGYADKAAGGEGILHYVDVPESHPFLQGVAKAYDDEGTDNRAPYVHFDAPEDIAKGLRPVPNEAEAVAEPAPAPDAPLDVHDVARQIAPDTFGEYDALSAHQDDLRQQIADAKDGLQRDAEAQAPHQAEIADLEERIQDTTPRLAKKYQARLDALRPERDAFLGDDFTMGALTRETPEIAALRQQLLETQYRMRDLAPDVTEAYRKAADQMPAEVPEPATPAEKEIASEPQETAISDGKQSVQEITPAPEPATPAQPELSPVANPGEPARPAPAAAREPPASIAGEVSKKLQDAGRPADEAHAAGQVTEAMWKTRADAFEGRKGTAEEMYAREAPEIKAGREPARARQPEMAQGAAGKIKLTEDGRSVITLMKSADASTFLHETGHDWLERMMRDAVDPAAPAAMKADGATVRSYLGIGESEAISTKAHEKFARSFERYFMEGRAPTQALADVFGKFKGWLTSIYQTVAKLRAPITPDIRDVFDRLLSSDPEARTAIVPEKQGDMFAGKDAGAGQLPVNGPSGKPTPLYPKLPKEPPSLIAFLRKEGGVRDDDGWIKNILGGEKVRPGLVKDTGMTVDAATIRAQEAGYFPEKGGENPSARELYDAIESDLRGEKRYSEHDADDVAAFHAAVEHNAEIERLANDNDIDTTGMTREQFYDALSEKLSRVKQDEEIRSLDAAHEADFDEAASASREWVEDHGNEWNTDEFYDITGPRSLEELESAHDADGQADASRPARQGGSDGQDDGSAAGHSELGEVGAGQGGRLAGDAGRAAEAATGDARPASAAAGTPPADRPASPGQPFGRSDTGLVDKAGNIRLDNLNQPEDVAQVIRDAAAANDEFKNARRGVVSDAQVIDLADALGMKASDLNQRKLGQAFNAEQVMAARKLLIQSATEVRDAMTKAATGSDADVLAYGEAAARHRMIQEQVSGITAEAGRALRAFRSIGAEGAQVDAIGDFVKAATGKTLFQMRREAQLGMTLETPQQISKFMQDSAKAGFWDKVLEYYTNGLISGPATHMTYAMGNQVLALWKAIPETAAAAAVGSVREALGGTGPRVMWGEVGAQMHGILFGQRDGFQAFVGALKSGLTEELPGENAGAAQSSFLAMQPRTAGAIPGVLGDVIRAPSRGVAAIHSYFRTIGYSQSLSSLAYRMASEEGLAGSAFDARLADLTANPLPEMMEQARNEATTQTLMGEGGDFTKKLASLSNSRIVGIPMLKFVLPFVKIGSNVMKESLLERSPLGVLDQGIRDNLMGRNGSVARDQQIARVAVGSALGAVTFGMAAEGLITGSGPSDPKEAAVWRLTGKQPYSIRVGDTWYAMHKLGPLAMVMGVAADLHEFGQQVDQSGADKVTALMAVSIARNVLDEGWMRGVSSMIQAMAQPDEFGAKYIRDQATSMLPFSVGMGQVSRAIDPYAREARTLTDAFKAKVPWLSETLLPRNDIWGQPIANKSDLGIDGLSSISESQVNNDPVNLALQRAQVFPSMPERKIVGVQLTDQQYNDYTRIAGRLAKMRLDPLVATPGFSDLPIGIQAKAMTEVIASSRKSAAELVKMQNPTIIQQAMQTKTATLTQGKVAARAMTSLNTP